MVRLKLGFVGHQAAKFACKSWHYSKAVPAGKLVRLGVWEDDRFIGVVLFGRGATKDIGKPYGLDQTEICELVRVALTTHETPVTRIVSVGLRMLQKQCPGLRLVVSYAATEHGHHGGIYQAGNWIYTGPIDSYTIVLKGRKVHARTVSVRYQGNASLDWLRDNVDPHAYKITGLKRHKYLMPLDAEMRRQVEPLRQPYPKREKQAMTGDQPEQRRGSTDLHAPSPEAQYERV